MLLDTEGKGREEEGREEEGREGGMWKISHAFPKMADAVFTLKTRFEAYPIPGRNASGIPHPPSSGY